MKNESRQQDLYTQPEQSPMRALSLWNPWAEAMRLGLKLNETRGRMTHVRGDVVICSAKRKLDEDGLAVSRDMGVSLYALKFGFALCVVEIYDCVPTDNFFPAALEFSLGDYSSGRFAWRARNLRVLDEPVPVKGGQGFFFITGEARKKIETQL